MKLFGAVLLIALTGLAGCAAEVSGPPKAALHIDGDAPIVMDSTEYTLRRTSTGWEGRLGYTIRNTTNDTISVLNCNGSYALVLEKRVDDDWKPAWAPILPECLSPPIEIPPHSDFVDELHLMAGLSGSNLYPQFTIDPPGIYRLFITSAYRDYTSPTWGEPSPMEAYLSHEFRIETEGRR